jgi:hypothetical protein
VLYPVEKLHHIMSQCEHPQMLELRLSSCGLISIECDLLARSPASQHLRSLDLSCNPIRLQGLLQLMQQESNLIFLNKLELYYCSINANQWTTELSSDQRK